jgi:hypothetical protein
VTIGIAVSGPRAGLAAFRALRAVEAVGRGAVGGFVSFVAIDADGERVNAQTQRGGGAALFGEGEPPPRMAEARLAVLMSSGADRPEPVSQFTPADPRAGLLTGHRFPNMPCAGGQPPNLIALERLRAGASPKQAIADTFAADPAADAGLIAMDMAGNIALANSAAVAKRDDIGEALAEDATSGLRIGVLHNSIHPHQALAALAVSAARDAVAPLDFVDGEASLIGVPLTPGDCRHLVLDAAGKPQAIVAAEKAWFDTCWEGSAVRRGDPVRMGGTVIGHVVREVYCVAQDGRVVMGRGGEHVGWRLAPAPQPT